MVKNQCSRRLPARAARSGGGDSRSAGRAELALEPVQRRPVEPAAASSTPRGRHCARGPPRRPRPCRRGPVRGPGDSRPVARPPGRNPGRSGRRPVRTFPKSDRRAGRFEEDPADQGCMSRKPPDVLVDSGPFAATPASAELMIEEIGQEGGPSSRRPGSDRARWRGYCQRPIPR